MASSKSVHLVDGFCKLCVCLPASCVEEVLKADVGQLHAEDCIYGGTPLHWAKTAEVNNVIFYVPYFNSV